MKKSNLKFFLFVTTLLIAGFANAQISYSVRGGMNLSNLYGDDAKDAKMKVGYNIGGLVDYEFVSNVGIQSGLVLTAKGAKGDAENVNVTINMLYLEVPVNIIYKIDLNAANMPVKFNVNVGPYLAYGVGGKTSIEIGNQSFSYDTFSDDGGYKKFDLGLGLGVGFEFGRVTANCGWEMGLINVADAEDTDVKTMNCFLTIGYKF
ncbi:MAG: PorT family protein [Paludibacteraceae bacterium]|nr:PorT family protein [Paludibacteraceae bacterium]MBP8945605.1 PorT family protein [Paludibacteraceae bacterium]